MPAWIESHTELRYHKKIKPTCDELKINRVQVIGHLHCLWWWAIENREDGDLSSLYDKDIADAADWTGDPTHFVEVLHRQRWLVNHKINDWMDYAGRLLRERERGRTRRKAGEQGSLFEEKEERETERPEKGIADEVVKLWNEICTENPAVSKLTPGREKKLRMRLKLQPNLDTWKDAFERVSESEFLTGKNDTEWKASFDWIIQNDENILKVLEGRYENRKGARGVQGKSERDQYVSPAVRAQRERDKAPGGAGSNRGTDAPTAERVLPKARNAAHIQEPGAVTHVPGAGNGTQGARTAGSNGQERHGQPAVSHATARPPLQGAATAGSRA